eukprot:m.9169 g.9169  ORF g.9169 m.9169 type:complete len:195 (-) comp4016_c0_seq1:85-669(-)
MAASRTFVLVSALCILVPSQAFGPVTNPHVYFSRTVEYMDPRIHLEINFGNATNKVCATRDAYGDNNCNIPLGTTTDLFWNLSSSMNFSGSAHLSAVTDGISTTVDCPVCGPACNFTLIGFPVHINLSPCPVTPGSDTGTSKIVLPDYKFFPKTTLSANVWMKDQNGNILVKGSVSFSVNSGTNQDSNETLALN